MQRPHPPIWIGADADAALDRAARLGDCWYINPHSTFATVTRQLGIYKAALERHGRPFPAELPMRRELFVARTREEALRLCRPYLETKYKAYHAWGQDKEMPEGDNDLGREFDALLGDRFLIRDVAMDGDATAQPMFLCQFIGDGFRPIQVDVKDGDMRPILGQTAGRGAANPAGAAGDDSDTSGLFTRSGPQF